MLAAFPPRAELRLIVQRQFRPGRILKTLHFDYYLFIRNCRWYVRSNSAPGKIAYSGLTAIFSLFFT
jgi:hypothetical protein